MVYINPITGMVYSSEEAAEKAAEEEKRSGGGKKKSWFRTPFKKHFGSTNYQNQLNSLPGAIGPASSAFWANTLKTNGPAYSLGAQPLYYAPQQGFYVTSADIPAAQGSVNFSSFGFGSHRRRRSRRSGGCPCSGRKKCPCSGKKKCTCAKSCPCNVCKKSRMRKGSKRSRRSRQKKKF